MEIRLAIIDDEADYLTAFCDYAEQTPGFARPLSYQDPKAALRGLEHHAVDVVLVDLMLERSSGVELIREIKTRHPKTRIIALSGYSNKELVHQVVASGVKGYLLKNKPLRDILGNLQQFFVNGVVMDPSVLGILLDDQPDTRPQDEKLDKLTRKERQILERLAVGKSCKQIADEQGRSVQTIYSHVKRMYPKIGVNSKTEAVVLFLSSNHKPAIPA